MEELPKHFPLSQNPATTGKSLKFIDSSLLQFSHARQQDNILQTMKIHDYCNISGIQNGQIKLVEMNLTQLQYKGRTVFVRVQFSDDYPRIPPKMYFQPLKMNPYITFLHANVYHDTGQICHPLLQQTPQQNPKKLSDMLRQICKLITSPNFNNAANMHLTNLYIGDKEEYEKAIRQNVGYMKKLQCESDEQNS